MDKKSGHDPVAPLVGRVAANNVIRERPSPTNVVRNAQLTR